MERNEDVRSWLAAVLFAGVRAGRLAHLHRRRVCYCCLARARGHFPLLRRRGAHSARIAPTIFLPTSVTRAASRRANDRVFSPCFVRGSPCEASLLSSAAPPAPARASPPPLSHILLTHLGTVPMTASSHQRYLLRCRSPTLGCNTLGCHAVCCSPLQCTRTIPTTCDRSIFVACCTISRALATSNRFHLLLKTLCRVTGSTTASAELGSSSYDRSPHRFETRPYPVTDESSSATVSLIGGSLRRIIKSWSAGPVTLLPSITDQFPVAPQPTVQLPVLTSTDP